MPDLSEMKWTPGAAYSHITTNETISGAQFKALPETGSPLVADMSSHILSRPVNVEKFGLIYAGAQKNIGPSGVTLVASARISPKGQHLAAGDAALPDAHRKQFSQTRLPASASTCSA
jgi:phosphoserine aminotransferase